MGGEVRICKKCDEEKSIYDFRECGNDRYNRIYFSRICRLCENIQNRKRNRKRQRENNLQRKFDMTEAQYKQKLKEQNNVCAICGQPETVIAFSKIKALAVDHREFPFKVRGLLCQNCNIKLAIIEDKEWVAKATKYLERNQ